MIKLLIMFLLTLPFVMAASFEPIMFTYRLIGLMFIFTSLFMIIGMFPINMINKTLNDKLNDGEMMLAIGIPALISSIIQWMLLLFNFLSIRQFITLMFFFNSGLYFAAYLYMRSKKLKDNPPEENYARRY